MNMGHVGSPHCTLAHILVFFFCATTEIWYLSLFWLHGGLQLSPLPVCHRLVKTLKSAICLFVLPYPVYAIFTLWPYFSIYYSCVYNAKMNPWLNHGSHNVLGVLTWIGGYQYFIPSQKRGTKFTNIRQSMLKLKHILASMIYFHSDMSKSTNTVVYFDWQTVIYIYVSGKCRTKFMQPMKSVTFTGACANKIIPKEGGDVRMSLE